MSHHSERRYWQSELATDKFVGKFSAWAGRVGLSSSLAYCVYEAASGHGQSIDYLGAAVTAAISMASLTISKVAEEAQEIDKHQLAQLDALQSSPEYPQL